MYSVYYCFYCTHCKQVTEKRVDNLQMLEAKEIYNNIIRKKEKANDEDKRQIGSIELSYNGLFMLLTAFTEEGYGECVSRFHSDKHIRMLSKCDDVLKEVA